MREVGRDVYSKLNIEQYRKRLLDSNWRQDGNRWGRRIILWRYAKDRIMRICRCELLPAEPFEDEMSHSVPDSARSVPWLVGGGAEPRNGKGA